MREELAKALLQRVLPSRHPEASELHTAVRKEVARVTETRSPSSSQPLVVFL